MYQALYRKYRPRSFEDVVSQETVKKILINSIKNNKISHAYLFSGPRGIGKTSIAKIFAKAVNCLEFEKNNDSCLECENCVETDLNSVDILEIDAASNNGVDQIRELKSKVNIVPSKLKYKVYIIDEVHMLSNSAFNALLKTLEEPPSHVIFVLATTEFYEVPETIVSRCQCFSFSRITNECLKDRLRYIANKENIIVDDEVLMEIAIYSNGGLRDAISMLDKLASFSDNKITMEDFITINGLISQNDIIEVYQCLIERNPKKILDVINKIDDSGYDFNNFVERIMIYIRDLIVNSFLEDKSDFDVLTHVSLVNKLNELLNTLKTCLNPLVMTQISLLSMIRKDGDDFIKEHPTNKKLITNNSQTQEVGILKNDVEQSTKKEVYKETASREKKEMIIDESVKNVRINNALADANLAFKNNFIKNLGKLGEYRLDSKYAKVIQLLDASMPLVVSDKYVIIGSEREATIERMYENYELIEEILEKINSHLYKTVYILKKDFEIIKNKYINDKKNGIIYKYQDEVGVLVVKNNKKRNSDLVDKALNVFGSDLVEIEEE